MWKGIMGASWSARCRRAGEPLLGSWKRKAVTAGVRVDGFSWASRAVRTFERPWGVFEELRAMGIVGSRVAVVVCEVGRRRKFHPSEVGVCSNGRVFGVSRGFRGAVFGVFAGWRVV